MNTRNAAPLAIRRRRLLRNRASGKYEPLWLVRTTIFGPFELSIITPCRIGSRLSFLVHYCDVADVALVGSGIVAALRRERLRQGFGGSEVASGARVCRGVGSVVTHLPLYARARAQRIEVAMV